MRSILEDAVVLYRHELDELQTIVAPAVLLGPILMIVAVSNLTAALATLPAFLALYGACYAASVRAAGTLLNNRPATATRVYRDVVAKSVDVLLASAPLALLAGGLAATALVAADRGYAALGFVFAALGVATALVWASRHAIGLPLILVYGLGAHDATHVGNVIARRGGEALPLLATASAPLLLVGVASWAIGIWLLPIVGAGLFAIALAVWLPFAALVVTLHASRLVDAFEPAA